MPRIPPGALRTACGLHPHIARLLPVCKDIRSAQNELRWLRERVLDDSGKRRHSHERVAQLVRRRSRGEPLQYLLGTEWFGDLELKVRPGVLIPRQETAASVFYLVDLIARRLQQRRRLPSQLRVLDFCTGSGCIPLLFQDEFYKRRYLEDVRLDVVGYDISPDALGLARENQTSQLELRATCHKAASTRLLSLRDMTFQYYDVLHDTRRDGTSETRCESTRTQILPNSCDILISNPPYISPFNYTRTTDRSVRLYEPKLALVPPSVSNDKDEESTPPSDQEQGDLFYPHLLSLAQRLAAKHVLLEVADLAQAKRVVALVLQREKWNVHVEIWRDDPARGEAEAIDIDGQAVTLRGEGNGRSVFIWQKD